MRIEISALGKITVDKYGVEINGKDLRSALIEGLLPEDAGKEEYPRAEYYGGITITVDTLDTSDITITKKTNEEEPDHETV